MMNLATPLRKADVKIERIGKEVVLYNSDQKAIHVLNPTAHAIWELCDGSHTVEDIERELKRSFSVPEGTDLIGDIRATIATFAEKNILESGG